MRTRSLPDFELRATVARWDKFLVIATDDKLVRDMIAVQKGGAGFKASPAFAKDSAGLPGQGNGFNLTTHTAHGERSATLQKQMLARAKRPASSNAQTEWMTKLMFLADTSGRQLHGVRPRGKRLADGEQGSRPGVGKVLGAAGGRCRWRWRRGWRCRCSTRCRKKVRRPSPWQQAKQIGLACKLYASDNDGKFPPTLDALDPDVS